MLRFLRRREEPVSYGLAARHMPTIAACTGAGLVIDQIGRRAFVV